MVPTDKGRPPKIDKVWFRARYGEHFPDLLDDEKDEVLIRTNGNPTYFAAGIAYHRNKLQIRGFDRAINIWGADHHGHVARLQAALDGLGLDGSHRLVVVLMQLVNLLQDGQPVRMSKRTGKAISLSDLLDEVPVDAARFFFNQREANTQMEFDLGLAIEQSSSNPVYYVQYAHARIHSIFRKMKENGIEVTAATGDQLALLTAPEERELIRHLSALEKTVVECAKNYDPSGITRYALELATLFHKFYNARRVKGEEESLKMFGVVIGIEDCKIYIHGVKYKLGADEHGEQVASCKEAENSDEEHQGGKYKVIFGRYHSSYLFLAINNAPTMQASRSTLTTSNGSTKLYLSAPIIVCPMRFMGTMDVGDFTSGKLCVNIR